MPAPGLDGNVSNCKRWSSSETRSSQPHNDTFTFSRHRRRKVASPQRQLPTSEGTALDQSLNTITAALSDPDHVLTGLDIDPYLTVPASDHDDPELAIIEWKRYQYEVEELMTGGVAFSQVEDAINDADLRDDAKSALWLLAWSLRDPSHQQQDARATLALIATYGG